MSKLYDCTICGSEFKNSRSLYTHTYKYHPKATKSKNYIDIKQKHGLNDSSNETESNLKTDSKQSSSSPNRSMEPYIKRLPKLVKITVDVLKDIKYLKKNC